jgi:radical SAM protein with 4Fe4S-binding SPASM domain
MDIRRVRPAHLGQLLLRKASEGLHLDRSLGRPYVFQVELTNFCNLKCPMCPHDLMTRSVGYMDFGLFRRVVAEVRATNPDLRLHNMGESLFHPEVGRFIRHAREQGLETVLSTNATTLTDRKIDELIEAELSWLYVSFDGTSADTYERFRKGARYERERAKVERLLEVRDARGAKYPQVMMSCIALPGTRAEVEEFRAYWDGRANAVRIKVADAWDGSSERIRGIVADEQPAFEPSVCRWPWQAMVVLWDGRVVPCCYDYDGKHVLGDLRRSTLAEIFNDAPMRELRRALREGRAEDVSLCRTCPRGANAHG